LSIYTQAWELTGRAQYKRIALGVRAFLRTQMMSAEGGFYNAQDAAVDGQEGISYVWTSRQIAQLLGPDAERFFHTYALVALPSEEAALDPDDAPGVLRVQMRGGEEDREARLAALEPARRKLLAARNQREQPPVDEKILAGMNGLAIEAFVTSARVFKHREDVDMAGRTAHRLWDLAWSGTPSRLQHGLYRGRAQGDGFVDDYALLVRGLLALHSATGERIWLVRARSLGDAMLRTFLVDSGALRSTVSTQTLILAPLEQGDGAYPAGISAAADALTRLFIATHSRRYELAAQRVAQQVAAQPERWPVVVAAINSGPPAQATTSRPATLAQTIAPVNDTAAHVRVTGVTRASPAHDEIAITLTIEPGYHVNANPASYD
jgi:uncharacterized protein YyaL (SSP411 family)